MAELLKWKQPDVMIEKAVMEWNANAKRMAVITFAGFIAVSLALCFLAYLPSHNWHAVIPVLKKITLASLFLLVFLMLNYSFTLRSIRDSSTSWFTEDGIYIRGQFWRWNTLTDAKIYNYEDIPNIKVLEVHAMRQTMRTSFDPSEVKESAIKDIVNKYAPGKMVG